MMFSEQDLGLLEEKVKSRISSYRYIHTLGVRDAALKIAEYCYSGDKSEIAAAALLHDISKEYSVAEQFDMMQKSNIKLTDTDLCTEPVFHSFTAPFVVERDFSEYSTANILSSVFSHTTGSPDMSLFDEIIFVADYVEKGRKYENCVLVREKLFSAFSSAKDREECISHLHAAAVRALEFTIIDIIKKGKVLNERTVATRNAFRARMPMPLSINPERVS